MDLKHYRASKGEFVKTKRLPRHRAGELFIKGPIPLEWMKRAAELPGKAIAVALAIWFQAGRTKTAIVTVTPSLLEDFSVGRHACRRALDRMAGQGLITVQRKPGCCPVVEVVDVGSVHTQSNRSTRDTANAGLYVNPP